MRGDPLTGSSVTIDQFRRLCGRNKQRIKHAKPLQFSRGVG